ncbi:MAG: aspartate aminotransferase family protein [Spirochaetaceae bacterium]|nr:aspartate aminotransferase family protein [Myxococcales bacterium]MCB9726825.1 aspartate aminotransferase family protein [Spirochaetaceae bacterium]HPG26960.1 pyridoxal-dependent decarboxylase [Myxococcota bacterium]
MSPSTTIREPGLLEDATARAGRYLDSLADRAVAADPVAVEKLRSRVGSGLPEAPTAPRAVLAELDAIASDATVASAGPRFFGFVHGGSLPVAAAASVLATAWDQNAFCMTSSPAGVLLEEIVLGWLREVLDLPADSVGAVTTGATVANFTALAAARHHLLEAQGWDVEADGLFGAPPLRVLLSAESHPTVRKALGLLGLGRDRVELIETDARGRIRVDAIPRIDGPTLVCAQAGNVNSGDFDPFDALADACAGPLAWLHVDGAFGLWARASRAKRDLARGLERADSWATDGHKWLNVPYDCGIAFVRESRALRGAMLLSAAYLPGDAPREPFHHLPETSRRARGVELWAALRGLGRSGIEELVDRCCRHARRFADGLSTAGYEILNEVVLNQVVVSFGDDETNRAVVDAVQRAGVCWCGPTEWRGRSAMRISVSCWATGDEDVERSIESIVGCARDVTRARRGKA